MWAIPPPEGPVELPRREGSPLGKVDLARTEGACTIGVEKPIRTPMTRLKRRAAVVAALTAALTTGWLTWQPEGRGQQAHQATDCKVHIGDLNWDSANFHDRVAGFILEHGYDCDVTLTYGGTLPIMAAHYEQKNDLIMELWYDNLKGEYDQAEENGMVQRLTANTPDGAQAWYIPRYVQEANPGLRSVFHLPRYKHLFTDPEEPSKGRFMNCIPGWACETINTVKLRAYGLDEHFTNFRPGSGGALDAAIKGPYLKRQPVLAYYWSPTPLTGELDLVKLEEPAWNEADWDILMTYVEKLKDGGEEAIAGATVATAYRTTELPKSVSTAFASQHPEIIDFLNEYTLSSETVNKALAYLRKEAGGSAEKTAIHFLKTNDVWKEWVPPNVAGKVETALGNI